MFATDALISWPAVFGIILVSVITGGFIATAILCHFLDRQMRPPERKR